MRVSRARLQVDGTDGTPRVLAAASVPQRWATTRLAQDGWVEAVQQAVGDGLFDGDEHRTRVDVRRAALVLRGVAATPLRRGRAATVTHLRARDGATLVHLPSTLIPQGGAEHVNALRLDVDAGSRAVAASIVVPGRTGMGERGRFTRLRLRTVAHMDGVLAFAEDATSEPGLASVDGPAVFDHLGAALSIIALGDWPVAEASWWRDVLPPDVRGGASRLRTAGVCVRVLMASLGDALEIVDAIETNARRYAGITAALSRP